jgi:hypothetical protein
MKQAARSWRVPRAIFIFPLVLWRNWQTIDRLVFRPKPRNRQTVAVVLRPKSKNLSQWFSGQTTNKPLTLVLRLNQETRAAHLVVHGADRTASPNLLIIRPPSTRPVLDHPRSPATRSLTPATILVTAHHAVLITCTLWDKQTWFSTQDNRVLGFKFKLR